MQRGNKMEEQTFHIICQELVDWKDELLEIEKELDEPITEERRSELQEWSFNLRDSIKRRLLNLNEDPEPWEVEILKEYGLYWKNG